MNTIVCRILIVIFWLSVTPSIKAREAEGLGSLQLTIIDAETGKETPARVEVLNKAGETFIAEDALPIIGNYCERFGDDDVEPMNEPLVHLAEQAGQAVLPQPLPEPRASPQRALF